MPTEMSTGADEFTDLKTFMSEHEIMPWPSENDRIEQVLRAAGRRVLLVEKARSNHTWRVCIIREEPDYFFADPDTVLRLEKLLANGGIEVPASSVRAKTASFRMEFTFNWSEGESGRGVSFGFNRRGRLVECHEEYHLPPQ